MNTPTSDMRSTLAIFEQMYAKQQEINQKWTTCPNSPNKQIPISPFGDIGDIGEIGEMEDLGDILKK